MKQELQEMLADCTKELDDIEKRINALPSFDKGRQYFTNYALMKACGTVEFVYRSIVADHFSQIGQIVELIHISILLFDKGRIVLNMKT